MEYGMGSKRVKINLKYGAIRAEGHNRGRKMT
jgi:hypothetical protein